MHDVMLTLLNLKILISNINCDCWDKVLLLQDLRYAIPLEFLKIKRYRETLSANRFRKDIIVLSVNCWQTSHRFVKP